MAQAIRKVAPAYSPAERAAWLGDPGETDARAERIAEQAVWVAEATDAGPVGFMTVTDEGEVDFAYILADCQGRGLFPRLIDALERKVRSRRLVQLRTFASLMADGPFARVGFEPVHDDPVERGEVVLRRSLMVRQLREAAEGQGE
ncbi:MAG: GNAT family N-acetyltransferase [Alphaproteobacteria bacterium]|jgi:putative acetyltransferase|nr:GNAT family N-acetyltransferase [Alphaproteobacteria bacterium]